MHEAAKVYLVGAGPGDPDLVTRKAERILRSADVVIYDQQVTPEILALANPNATFIYAGRNPGCQEETQAEIDALLLRYGWRGGCVVRLRGGDPLVFAHSGEELRFLHQHGFDVEVVPGVSSATALRPWREARPPSAAASRPLRRSRDAAGTRLRWTDPSAGRSTRWRS